ncbi:putative Core histone H2A H2B H3 H4 [Trypanosoma vivax]|uniref:Histone H2B n=1 Tax=Trypanosoma vivax (strain Y486) TaxID=1055687 RepID=G0UBU9_TRYVY|nr:histone H2B variant [Trypanosoma vivax]KAH8609427.1 putative Core histone H2A H2B H3 H4 [Trypanosoma vivax]KAH8609515.1 putative Core histone H2A H2B H3 H4 [Trypanosoma vivax]KAH8609567.1 putative Core histone H2A H2B H3 H4 [Trypanosoma vivax]CCC53297.1 putative histone H2B variant [Trypanosoma vivax Y486]
MPPTKGGKRPLPLGGKGKGKGAVGRVAKPSGGKDKKGARRGKKQQRWDLYIHRTLRQVYKRGTLSKAAVRVLSSFIEDMYGKIQAEAVHVACINNVKTLTAREIQTSARLLLPPELAKHAMSEGTKAVAKYNASREEAYSKTL